MNHALFRISLACTISILVSPVSALAQSDAGVEVSAEPSATEAREVPTTEEEVAPVEPAPPPTDEHHEAVGTSETPAPLPPAPETTTTTTTVEDTHVPTPVEVAAATPTASTTGATSSAPVVAIVAGIPIRVTGILWGSIFGGTGVESFGWANTSAPTSALNPLLLGTQAADAQLSFQVQQSRFGMTLGEGTPFRGTFEIDFIHFDQQSSPTTQAFPRIRIAMLQWNFDANNRIFVGQNWDLFGNTNSSLLSHSANLVGTMFQAGNIGFMRQQLGWSGRFGDFEIAAAVGMQGNNQGPTFNNLEESATPTLTARVMYHLTETSVLGISGIGTAPRFTDTPHTNAMTGQVPEQRRVAAGGELFADLTFGPLNLHAEAYVAQNIANTGSLNLGQGRYGQDVADAGGYASVRITLSDWAITAMYGFAGLLRPDLAVPAYTVTTGGPGSPYSSNVAAAGPGIEWNMSGHVGLWYSPMRGLSFVLEPYFYYTRFILAAPDAAQGVSQNQLSGGGQFTTMFQF